MRKKEIAVTENVHLPLGYSACTNGTACLLDPVVSFGARSP
jgi:hypothetical protein